MDYTNYGPEDFLTDERFIRWVKHPDERSEEFWQQWMEAHPEKQKAVEQARELLKSLRFQPNILPERTKALMEDRIGRRIGQATVRKPVVRRLNPAKYAIAASLAGILLLTTFILYRLLPQGESVYRTGYAEMKTVQLPDGSIVILNANSEISYNVDPETGNREVALDGEAYFQVNHQKINAPGAAGARRFIVHTPGMDVVVLGTEFNVNNRRGSTKVVLESGEVKLQLGPAAGGNAGKELIMKPGEMASYIKENASITLQTVNIKNYISWKNNLLVFNKTPLSEIARLLEDNYNYRVRIEGEGVARKIYEGTFPADDITVLIQTLEKSVSIETNGRNIIIREKK